jgi:hypothetical protein
MNVSNQTYDLPVGLSDLMGAYDTAHWETVLAELKPDAGVLARGSVLALVSGKLELVTATNQATVYGVLLDPSIDTAAKFSDDSVTGSVARSGSFRGPALIVSVGVDPVALAADLRDRGIYTEGPIPVPAALAAEPEGAPAEA